MTRETYTFSEHCYSKQTLKIEDSAGIKQVKVLSLSDDQQFQDCSSRNIIQFPGQRSSIFQCRYFIALLEFLVFFQINAYMLNTSISVVAMAKSAANTPDGSNDASESCPVNTSETSENSYSEVKEGEFDWSPAIQGYILSAGFLGFFITQMPGGMLAEIYGAKPVIVFGLLLSSVGHFLTPFAAWANSSWLIGIQFLRGCGQGLMPAAQSVLAANWFPSIERGFLNSMVYSGGSIGAFTSGFSSGFLCSSSIFNGWPSVFYIYGVLGVVLCLCFQVSVFESPKVHPRISEAELTYISQNQEMDLSQKRPPTPWRRIFTSVPVYAMMYAMFASFWIVSHSLSIQPIFYNRILHFTIQETGYFTSLTFILQAIILLIGSWTSKWLDSHNYIGVDKVRKGSTLLCTIGYSLCLVGVYFSGCDRALSSVLSIISMGFNGISYTGSMITPIDMSPTFAGTLMGLSNCVGTIGTFIFPILVGIMTNEEQTLEQWNKIFMICVGLLMSSGIVFCVFGSGDVQPWNFPTDETDTKYSKDKNESENGQNPMEPAIHI